MSDILKDNVDLDNFAVSLALAYAAEAGIRADFQMAANIRRALIRLDDLWLPKLDIGSEK